MTLDEAFITSLAQAVGLGLGVAILLRILRRYGFVRRVWLTVLGTVVALGLGMVLRAVGVPPGDLSLKIISGIAILLGAYALLQFLDLALWEYLLGRVRHIIVPRLLVDLFNALVLVVVALVVLDRVFSVDLTAVLVTSTVVSAVIGLSLQDTLGNVMAGLAMQLDRPFDVGDWVNIAGRDGRVTQMNWRTTNLCSLDNHRYIIPNANVARHDVVNYSRPTALQRLHVSIGLSYASPPGDVKRVLSQALATVDGVRRNPAPDALVQEYGESAIIYDVRYWIDDYSRHKEIQDQVLTRLWYAIRRAGMSVPFPIRDVNLRQVPEDHEQQQQEKMRRAIFDQLRPLAVFAPLSDEQIRELARHARWQQFTAGELLVRQGDRGDTLFVIHSGRMRVDARGQDGRVTTVAKLGPGEFFGEMSLLTGEHRSASVIAETEAVVVVLGSAGLAEVLATDMAALAALSEVVEQRLRDSAEKIAAAAETRSRRDMAQAINLLGRIQSFLGFK